MDINGVEAASMIINFRFSNASELEQALGRGNRSPHIHTPVDSLVFLDALGVEHVSELKEQELANLASSRIAAYFALCRGVAFQTPLTARSVQLQNEESLPFVRQCQDASQMLAELLGQEDREAHRYAIWVLLKATANQEAARGVPGLASADILRPCKVIGGGVGNFNLVQRGIFPYNAVRWAHSNTTRAAQIEVFILEQARILSPIRVAMLLLQRGHQCCWDLFNEVQTNGTSALGLVTNAYCRLIRAPPGTQAKLDKAPEFADVVIQQRRLGTGERAITDL